MSKTDTNEDEFTTESEREAESERQRRNVDAKIREELAKFAGMKFSEDSITFEGTRLVLPENMSAKAAVRTLQAYIKAEEEETEFSRIYKYRPWDGAAAFSRAVKNLTGTSGIGKAQWSFFGKQPPQMLTIPTGVDETTQVPWGAIEVELFEGTVFLNATRDTELGLLFALTVNCPKKHRAAVEGLFKMVQEELEARSIYRGKAFDGKDQPEFLDLRLREAEIVYNTEVWDQLDANVWSMLTHSESMRIYGVPLKRSVLLHGPYGTGKTLAAFLTAKKAVESGWTFIYCRPAKDDLFEVMQTARLYQPSVVFFEDVDTVAAQAEKDHVTELLDVFDGISSKSTEILAILTTNHPEKIHRGMVRPGRLDSVIEIGHLDEPAIAQLVEAVVPPEKLAGDIDFAQIAKAMDRFLPAFVKEAIDRTKRYAIARTGGELDVLTTDDFVKAANGLRPQLDMMNEAGEGVSRPTLDAALAEMVTRELSEMRYHMDSDTLVISPVEE